MNKQIKNWSFSRLTEYESCSYRSFLKIIQKVPEPERPLPPGKTEHANDRGSRIHDEIEQYIRGSMPFPKEALSYKDEIESLKTRFNNGQVSLEGEWGFDADWEPTAYRSAWLKVKCDAVITLTPKHVTVVDYKTGRKDGNEMKHNEQLQLYAIAASIMYPKAETITVELWYLDKDDITQETKPASKWMYAIKGFNNRGRKMTTATEFKPNPNVFSCQYCPYLNGACEHGTTRTTKAAAFAKAPRRKRQVP